jgi:hypothetical protein
MSEAKQTSLDILFDEIKISKSFMPDHLFKWLESVYSKSKEIEKMDNKHMEIAEEIITIDHKYNNLSDEKKEDILNLLIAWSLDELKKLNK